MNRIPESRGKKVLVAGLAVLILVPASIGFCTKIFQFVKTLRGESGAEFTLIPLTNYVLAAVGFGCLLVWATMHGMFRDVEKPKYDMLEQEEELERSKGVLH